MSYRAFGALRAAVKADLRELNPRPDALVLVACSGGADSLALAGALAAESREVGRSNRRRGHPIRVGAVIVDHGLLPDSAAVAARAAEQCRALGLESVEVIRIEVPDDGGGPEGSARTARYQALAEAAGRLGAAAVYLGHTLDDQAETVLLGLARGSGIRSLAGMRAVHGIYHRPFLGLRRSDTVAACEFLTVEPWQDPSNRASGDDAPLRSRVRHELLPVMADVLGPGIAEALARTAALTSEDADLLDQRAEELFAETVDSALSAEPSRRMTEKLSAEPSRRMTEKQGESDNVVSPSFCGPGRGAQNPEARLMDSALSAEPSRRMTEKLSAEPSRRMTVKDSESDNVVSPSFCGPGRGAQTRGPRRIVDDSLGWENPEARLILDVATLAAAPAPIRRRALKRAALAADVPAGSLAAAHIAALDSLVANWRGQGPTYLPSGVKVYRRCGRLYFCPAGKSLRDQNTASQPPAQ